jgi:hypothetical protein
MVEAVQVDPSRCPLCGEANRCAMEVERETGLKQPPCWCMATDVDFSPELLDRVPVGKRRLACICARCAALAVVQD